MRPDPPRRSAGPIFIPDRGVPLPPRLLPALGLIALGGLGLVVRFAAADWRGLWDRPTPAPPPALARVDPPASPPTKPECEPLPIPEPTPMPAPAPRVSPPAPPQVAEPADRLAWDEIRREAERREAEADRIAKLKDQARAEADDNPPPPSNRRPDPVRLALQRREMERQFFLQMERQREQFERLARMNEAFLREQMERLARASRARGRLQVGPMLPPFQPFALPLPMPDFGPGWVGPPIPDRPARPAVRARLLPDGTIRIERSDPTPPKPILPDRV